MDIDVLITGVTGFVGRFILLELIENYNEVIDNEYDQGNLNSLTNLETIARMNGNESIQW